MQLVRALSDAPDGRPMQWRMIEHLDGATADAVEFAAARAWVQVVGGHIALTEAGRLLAKDLRAMPIEHAIIEAAIQMDLISPDQAEALVEKARHLGSEQWHRVSNWVSPGGQANGAELIGVTHLDPIQIRSVGWLRMDRGAGREVPLTDCLLVTSPSDQLLDKSFPAVASAKVICITVMHKCRLNKVLSMAQLATKVTK
jgi:hypothetical protein